MDERKQACEAAYAAFMAIVNFSDTEMRDVDTARDLAKEWLSKWASDGLERIDVENLSLDSFWDN